MTIAMAAGSPAPCFTWCGRTYIGRIPTPAELEAFVPRFALLEQRQLQTSEIAALYRDFLELLFPDTSARIDELFFGLVRRMVPGESPATIFLEELPDAVQAAALRGFCRQFLTR